VGSDDKRSQGSVVLLPVEEVVRSFFGMRVADRGVGELAVSIRRHGLLHPIVVRPLGQVFEVVAGHRRFEACKLLGWKEVPSLVMNVSDKEAYELSLIENIQRETLGPIEEAEAYSKYVNHFGWGSVSELARKVGKSQEYVSHRMLLLRLPSEILEKVRTGELTPWQAQELVWLGDSSLVTKFAKSIIRHKLTVNEIRDIRRNIRDGFGFRDSVRRALRNGGSRRGAGWVEALQVTRFDSCIKNLKKVVLLLNKAIDDASLYQDETLRVFLVDKRSVVQLLMDDLWEKRRKYPDPGADREKAM